MKITRLIRRLKTFRLQFRVTDDTASYANRIMCHKDETKLKFTKAESGNLCEFRFFTQKLAKKIPAVYNKK